mmetsp:Transcript_63404/g.147724  ORF Transcript_63404/g.147724 Transcript_63404/m.147724 type:complete len:558 (-) Transcript_63404:165-1838(-)
MNAARLLLLGIVGASAGKMDEMPGGAGCELDSAGYASGLHHVRFQLDGKARLFLLFVPTKYTPHVGVPLWLLAPGAYETPGRFLHVSGMLQFAEANSFAFAVLQGVKIDGMNVGLHGQSLPTLPDDVEYTRAILRDVSQKLCVNMDRIRCTGYSRGARFCSRLASEMSSFVKGIAPVAGLRYPTPNNATRPQPIIAIHGTRDEINPYWGKGDPTYWHSSVPDAVNNWAKFNRCKYNRWVRKTEHVVLYEHFDCRDDASVVLVMVEGDGHTWPGSHAFVESQFGNTTDEIDANTVMKEFFMKHPEKSYCHTAVKGELCYDAVKEAMEKGLSRRPGWQQRLETIETFEDYQYELHINILADCSRPCPKLDKSNKKRATHGKQDKDKKEKKRSREEGREGGSWKRLESLRAIEGRWMRNTQPGRFTEIIKDGNIYWDVGPVTKIAAEGNGRFTTQWQGSTYHSRLVRGDLVWDDGDVWARVKEDDGQNSLFAMTEEITKARNQRLPTGSPYERSAAALAVLAVGSAIAFGIAAVLRGTRRGRQQLRALQSLASEAGVEDE